MCPTWWELRHGTLCSVPRVISLAGRAGSGEGEREGGAPGHLLVHLLSLPCVACWERAALRDVPFLCAGPQRLPC